MFLELNDDWQECLGIEKELRELEERMVAKRNRLAELAQALQGRIGAAVTVTPPTSEVPATPRTAAAQLELPAVAASEDDDGEDDGASRPAMLLQLMYAAGGSMTTAAIQMQLDAGTADPLKRRRRIDTCISRVHKQGLIVRPGDQKGVWTLTDKGLDRLATVGGIAA